MICPQCKTEIDENSKYCTECGYDFTKITSQPQKKTTKDPLDDLNTVIKAPETHNARSELDAKGDTNMGLKVGIFFAGRYEILSEGKRGGMGIVYKVKDITLNKVKALKVIHPNLASEENAVLRFKEEVALSQDLVHLNIVKVYDFGESSGIQYFTMEWVDGVTLREVINKRRKEKKPFNLNEAYEIVSQLADALDSAHRTIIHRDIKPENILVAREIDTGKLTVKLTDFGIAKMLTPSQMISTTSQMGTPYYMAPEQREDAAHVDKKADIYALGVVLFELLTLENTIGLEGPSEINKELPKEIDVILKKAIATKPEDRYKEVKELSGALKALLVKVKGGVEAEAEVTEEKTEKVVEEKKPTEPPERSEAVSPRKQEKPFVKWTVFIVLLFAVIGFIYTYTLKKEVPKPPEKPISKEEAKSGAPQEIPKPKPEGKPKPEVKEQKDLTKEKKNKGETVPPKQEPKQEAKQEAKQEEVLKVDKVLPDQEKRSAIIEANGYAMVSKEKEIKELQKEAYEDARRQAAQSAQAYIQGLTRSIKVTYDISKSHGQVEVKVLEQKDFGIEDGKHYRIWLKAEVQYKLEKPSLIPRTALLNPQAPLTVSVWTDKKEYREGEQLRIYLQGNKPFYARIIYVDVSGKIIQLLPNAYRTQNSFESGKIYIIPDQGDRFKLEIEPPFGLEKVMVFASPNPLGDVSMEQLDKGLYGYRGDIKTLGTRSRDVRSLSVKPTEPGQQSGGAAEFYEALWQVQTHE